MNEIAAISPKLYARLRDTLLSCGPFDTDGSLKALFVDQRLSPWRNQLPQADTTQERVEKTIDFLLDKQHDETGANALVSLLLILRERTDANDACRSKLDDLAEALLVRVPGKDKEESSPFKGLQHFEESDADLFFGREALTSQMVAHLRGRRFLAVVGASGSGKSSLVRAGIIPALKGRVPVVDDLPLPAASTDWEYMVITPTSRPLEQLALAVTSDLVETRPTQVLRHEMMSNPKSLRLGISKRLQRQEKNGLLLLVDQFEELFTSAKDMEVQRAFIDNLLAAVDPDLPTRIIVTLRADFYTHCARYANMRQVLSEDQMYIGAMSRAELRRAIVEPARRNDWYFEQGLVDLLLREAGDDPGMLPLLSHALEQTWEHRSGRTMTHDGYDAAGGVKGAIARTAEDVYGRLLAEEQVIARNILLRLTELGEGTEDTRRRATLQELIPATGGAAVARGVLKVLADARLVVTDRDAVEVTHEALIREWPTFRRWLTEDRRGLVIHRQLTDAAADWEASGRDSAYLHRGIRLQEADEWAESHRAELNQNEQAFLDASNRSRQRARWKMIGVAVLVLFLLILIPSVAAITFFRENAKTRAAELEARARFLISQGQVEADERPLLGLRMVIEGLKLVEGESVAIQESVAADSRATVIQWGRVLALGTDVRRIWTDSMTTTLVIEHRNGTPDVRDAATGTPLELQEGVDTVHLSPDGALVVVTNDNGYGEVRDGSTGELLETLPEAEIIRVSFSPDGALFFVNYLGAPSEMRDGTTGELFELRPGARISSVDFSRQGTLFFVTYTVSDAELWDAATGALLATISDGRGIDRVFLSPVDALFIVTYIDLRGEIRNGTTGELLATLPDVEIADVYFSPTGEQFFVEFTTGYEGADGEVRDGTTGELLALRPNADVSWVDFSSTGALFSVYYTDGYGEVRDGATGELLTLRPGAEIARGYFSPDGTLIFVDYVRAPSEVRDWTTGDLVWSLPTEQSYRHFYGVRFSPTGAMFVVDWSTNYDDEIRDGKTGELIQVEVEFDSVYFSPDSTVYVVDYPNAPGEVREGLTGELLGSLPKEIGGVDFSPDGTLFVADYVDGSSELWSKEPKFIASLGVNRADHFFVSDNERLVVWYLDGRAFMLDVRWLRSLAAAAAEEGVGVVELSPTALVQLACDGPLATGLSDEAEALFRNYLAGNGQKACQD